MQFGLAAMLHQTTLEKESGYAVGFDQQIQENSQEEHIQIIASTWLQLKHSIPSSLARLLDSVK